MVFGRKHWNVLHCWRHGTPGVVCWKKTEQCEEVVSECKLIDYTTFVFTCMSQDSLNFLYKAKQSRLVVSHQSFVINLLCHNLIYSATYYLHTNCSTCRNDIILNLWILTSSSTSLSWACGVGQIVLLAVSFYPPTVVGVFLSYHTSLSTFDQTHSHRVAKAIRWAVKVVTVWTPKLGQSLPTQHHVIPSHATTFWTL